jgi:hypothetical protein
MNENNQFLVSTLLILVKKSLIIPKNLITLINQICI